MAGTAGGAAAPPIKLALIVPVGTPIQNYPDAEAGARAAARAVNATGGVRGRQIEISFCNTQSNPNTAVSCAREAVASGAVAVVGHIDTFSPLSLPILRAAGVPDVGFYTTGNPTDWSNPSSFPIVGGATASYLALPFAFKKLGKKRVAIFFHDVPSAATNAKLVAGAARAARIQVVDAVTLPGATTDFTAFGQRLRESRADSVVMIGTAGTASGLMRAAAAFGLSDIVFGHNAGTIGEKEAEQLGATGTGLLLGSPLPTYRDDALLGVKRFLAEMRAAGYTNSDLYKAGGMNAWLSVHAVARVAAGIRGSVTPASLTRALRAQRKPIDLFGLASFAPGAKGPAAYPRWPSIRAYYLRVQDGQVRSWGRPLSPVQPLRLMGIAAS